MPEREQLSRLRDRIAYRLACWWLDSPRVDRVRRYVLRKAEAR
jgi:hypothetical protein